MTSVLQAPIQSPTTTRLLNALVTRLLPIDLNLGPNHKCHLSLANLRDPKAPPLKPAFTIFVNAKGLWRISFSNLDFLVLREEFANFLEADPNRTLDLLPPILIRVAIERLFLPLLDTIAQKTQIPAFFMGQVRVVGNLNFNDSLDLMLLGQGATNFQTIINISFKDPHSLEPLLTWLEAQPNKQVNPEILMKVISAELKALPKLGTLKLTLTELKSLECGDILFPENLSLTPSLCLPPNIALTSKLDGKTLEVQAMENLKAANYGEDQVSQTPSDNATPILNQEQVQNLELELCFALPYVKFPLGECAKLIPGYTFTLDQDIAHLPIQVLIGGQAIAKGRFVEVSGTLGVQLTQVLKQTLAMAAPEASSEETTEVEN